MTPKKKLIEVALPLDAINKASAREKSIRHGHPSTLHLWWARRPLAAARAVIFAQMVDDPSAHPDLFPTEEEQETERQRLFRIIEELVTWESTTNENVLRQARAEIWRSWKATCAENADHPRADELFNPERLPAFHDPFAGGGALPLEAQRLGLDAYATDLNPVAVLINKAMVEIPPKFIGKPPVNPLSREEKTLLASEWLGAAGLAEDVRHYGEWMRSEAEVRIGHLYPGVTVTPKMAEERRDLESLVGEDLRVIAWLWARTVKSPNPAFPDADVPLISNFMLSTKAGRESYVEPVVDGDCYRFSVRIGKPSSPSARAGTKLGRGANFRCLVSGSTIDAKYIRAEARAGRMGERLMAVVVESKNGRLYLPPSREMEIVARSAQPDWQPDVEFLPKALGFRVGNYGMSRWSDLFTSRQTVALDVFSQLVGEARAMVARDARLAGYSTEGKGIAAGGSGSEAYADAVAVYLACGVSRACDYWNANATWESGGGFVAHAFTRQAISMVWDFAEANPFSNSGGNWLGTCIKWVERVIRNFVPAGFGKAEMSDAQRQSVSAGKVISTDPPYYDNVGYADLSDFFYVWLRRSLKDVFPDLFATLAVPKMEELVATPARHGGKESAEAFFLDGMTLAMQRLATHAHPAFPVTVYYAFKQAELDGDAGAASTGWETFLASIIASGFAVHGTWPLRTERAARTRGIGSNALASSILLVCRHRSPDAPSATRQQFVTELRQELPVALGYLQHGNIAPVDLAQSAIGPGIAVYTRYSSVLDAQGTRLSVRQALALINETLDGVLAAQEGDFDSDSRWALAWFEQHGFNEGEYGTAETLSKAKNTSVSGLVEAGILSSKAGKVRLLAPYELSHDWDPATDTRLTVWEMVHHLIRRLEDDGESGAALLLRKMGTEAPVVRELAYRLYNLCERKKRAPEALAYNSLVQSWVEIERLAGEGPAIEPHQQEIF